jgi:hypothetical protein
LFGGASGCNGVNSNATPTALQNAVRGGAGGGAGCGKGNNTFGTGGAGGISRDQAGGTAGNNGNPGFGYPGSGGGGGNSSATTPLVGGDGGIPGGGGGGGGTTENLVNGANGGLGARGEIWVIEYGEAAAAGGSGGFLPLSGIVT